MPTILQIFYTLGKDGLLAHYFPDFMVKIGNTIYVVETKAERDVN